MKFKYITKKEPVAVTLTWKELLRVLEDSCINMEIEDAATKMIVSIDFEQDEVVITPTGIVVTPTEENRKDTFISP